MNVLVDASIYIFQYYFSLPDHWFSEEGYPTAAVYGYTTFLLRFIEQEQPKKMAICFDESLGTCFRNRIYPNYKMSRELPDEALAFQLRACRRVSELLGLACFSSKIHEADDFIGTLAKKLRRSREPIGILSRDKDLGQLLLRPQDYLWDYTKGQRHFANDVLAKFGVAPTQLVDYLALVGDAIDDIPGVPGLGPKTASALLNRYQSLARLFKTLKKQDADALRDLPLRGTAQLTQKLLLHSDQIRMSQQLARIVDDVAIKTPMTDLAWRPQRVKLKKLVEFCRQMGFPRLEARVRRLFQNN